MPVHSAKLYNHSEVVGLNRVVMATLKAVG